MLTFCFPFRDPKVKRILEGTAMGWVRCYVATLIVQCVGLYLFPVAIPKPQKCNVIFCVDLLTITVKGDSPSDVLLRIVFPFEI